MALTGILGAAAQGLSSGINALNTNVSQGIGYTNSNASGWGEEYGGSSNFSRTFGIEATALQKQLADEANALQRELYEDAKKFNTEQAEKNREWQEKMSNTAVQRQMQDLKKAGINPILAANYMGAATPSGAQASTGIQSVHMANAIPDSISGGSSSNYGHSGNESYTDSKNASKTNSWLNDIAKATGQLFNINNNDAKRIIKNPSLASVLSTLSDIANRAPATRHTSNSGTEHGGYSRSF